MFSRFVHLHSPKGTVFPARKRGLPAVLSEAIFPAKRSSIGSLTLLFAGLLLSLAIIHAPSFLLLCEAPVKADAVVLFVGGEGAREREAEQLIKEGFADYLIIPAHGQIKKRGPDGRLGPFDLKRSAAVPNQRTNEQATNRTVLSKTPTSKSLGQNT